MAVAAAQQLGFSPVRATGRAGHRCQGLQSGGRRRTGVAPHAAATPLDTAAAPELSTTKLSVNRPQKVRESGLEWLAVNPGQRCVWAWGVAGAAPRREYQQLKPAAAAWRICDLSQGKRVVGS